jgi:hypothetical protein
MSQAEPCPANDNLPAAQLVQVSMAVAPTAVENVPASHAVQTAAPAPEYSPAAQSVHATVPVADLYFPAAHALHP